MPLLLTSRSVLSRIHHAAETSKLPRSTLVLSTAASAGLAMGKTHSHRRAPVGLAGGGVLLSFLGFSAIGDGAAAAGATILGYKTGTKMARKAAGLPVSPAAPHLAAAPAHGGKRVVRKRG